MSEETEQKPLSDGTQQKKPKRSKMEEAICGAFTLELAFNKYGHTLYGPDDRWDKIRQAIAEKNSAWAIHNINFFLTQLRRDEAAKSPNLIDQLSKMELLDDFISEKFNLTKEELAAECAAMHAKATQPASPE
jgi:hypothetical protein